MRVVRVYCAVLSLSRLTHSSKYWRQEDHEQKRKFRANIDNVDHFILSFVSYQNGVCLDLGQYSDRLSRPNAYLQPREGSSAWVRSVNHAGTNCLALDRPFCPWTSVRLYQDICLVGSVQRGCRKHIVRAKLQQSCVAANYKS
jgi:hypothetical protein